MSQSSTLFSLVSQPIVTKDVQNRIPVPASMSNSKMLQVQNSSSSNSNTNSNTNDNPSMQDLMNLIKGQSSLINSLQKTISSLQNTIDGLNLKLEEFENGSRGINKDVNKGIIQAVKKDVFKSVDKDVKPMKDVGQVPFSLVQDDSAKNVREFQHLVQVQV